MVKVKEAKRVFVIKFLRHEQFYKGSGIEEEITSRHKTESLLEATKFNNQTELQKFFDKVLVSEPMTIIMVKETVEIVEGDK